MVHSKLPYTHDRRSTKDLHRFDTAALGRRFFGIHRTQSHCEESRVTYEYYSVLQTILLECIYLVIHRMDTVLPLEHCHSGGRLQKHRLPFFLPLASMLRPKLRRHTLTTRARTRGSSASLPSSISAMGAAKLTAEKASSGNSYKVKDISQADFGRLEIEVSLNISSL